MAYHCREPLPYDRGRENQTDSWDILRGRGWDGYEALWRTADGLLTAGRDCQIFFDSNRRGDIDILTARRVGLSGGCLRSVWTRYLFLRD